VTYISDVLRQLVIERANGCCEYCRLHRDDNFMSHEVDHIRAEKHRGETISSNLCYSCMDCNRRKGSDFASFDVETDEVALLFNPRHDQWSEHFNLNEAVIQPLTPTGRVTVFLLDMNHPDQVTKRIELIKLNRYPC
jgi:hypothetical protein